MAQEGAGVPGDGSAMAPHGPVGEGSVAAPSGLWFGVLGPLEVRRDGELLPLPRARERALLGLLLSERNRVVPVPRLVDGVWGAAPPPTAEKTLQSYISRLRRLLEPDLPPTGWRVVVTAPPGYSLRVGAAALDADLSEQLAGKGRAALAAGAPELALARLRRALGLWRGEAYADLGDAEFAVAERDRLAELRLAALADHLDAELALGHAATLVGELQRLVAEHPLRERFWGQLMVALYESGRQVEALEAYRAARTRLVGEIGVEPGPQLRALEAAILAERPRLRPGAVRPQDMPAGLGADPNPLVGRDAELRRLEQAWTRALDGAGGAVRVEGEPGMGASRLVAEFARRVGGRGAAVVLAPVGAEKLAATTVERPVLVVIDDPPGVDPEELGRLAAAVAPLPVLVIAVARPSGERTDRTAGAVGVGSERVVRLGPLGVEQVAAVVAGYVPDGELAEAAEAVAASSGGVPARVHEHAAALAATRGGQRAGRSAEWVASGRRDPASEVLWGLVPPRNLFFTGRGQVLADLHARLTGPAGGGGLVVAISALAGMGGVGKTQLAAEYAHRYADAYQLVWWVSAETPTQAAAGLTALADALGIRPDQPAQRQARLWTVLASRTDWLLVYDNATDPDLLAAILPPRVSGRVLVTSRARLPRLPTVDVGVFDRAESVTLLHHHLPGLSAAGRVAAALADLPLAVDQAGAYLAETPIGVDAYLHLLADQPHLVLAEATPDHAGLAATVTAARARLAALHPGAAALLDQLAFLAPDPVPLALASQAGGGLVVADEAEPGQAAEWLRLLVRLALARRTGTGVQLHRLVAALLRARLGPNQRAATLGRCLHLLASATPGDPNNPAAWPAWAALAPHLQAATTHLAPGGPPAPAEPGPFRELVADCAWYLRQSGQLHPARQLAAAALSRWASGHPGPDHPHTLHVATALAAALIVLGEHPAARDLAQDTLARCRRILGHDHPATLASATALAAALAGLGEHPAARDLAQDSLARCRRILGDDHPATLASAAALAAALTGLGEHPAARELAVGTLAAAGRSSATTTRPPTVT